MDESRFDAQRLRSLLESYLADSAMLTFSEDDQIAWIFPNQPGSPIQLRLEEDVCVVLAGFSFRVTVSAGEPGSEWMIFDCIEAIIEGRGSEYYDFTSNYLNGERSDGVAGASFAGRNVGTESGEAEAQLVRRIPAWDAAPPRPRETTMDVLWGHSRD